MQYSEELNRARALDELQRVSSTPGLRPGVEEYDLAYRRYDELLDQHRDKQPKAQQGFGSQIYVRSG
jgi:hypothetical protein